MPSYEFLKTQAAFDPKAVDPGIPIVQAAAPEPTNAFAGAKVSAATAAVGGNPANITNTTTNPSGATGPAATGPAATGPAATGAAGATGKTPYTGPGADPSLIKVAGGNGMVGANAQANSIFQQRFAPTAPATAAQLAPGAAGARAANASLLAGGGIGASRAAYLRGQGQAGEQQMTRHQAMTNMLLANMLGLYSPDEGEAATPEPKTVGEAKAFGT